MVFANELVGQFNLGLHGIDRDPKHQCDVGVFQVFIVVQQEYLPALAWHEFRYGVNLLHMIIYAMVVTTFLGQVFFHLIGHYSKLNLFISMVADRGIPYRLRGIMVKNPF